MSSLRINHQGRAIGAPAGSGDSGRPEHADDGVSFAFALGAAAGATPKDAAMLLGKKSGGTDSAGLSAPRKRTDDRGRSTGAAAAAAASIAASALVIVPTVADATGTFCGAAAAASTGSVTATDPMPAVVAAGVATIPVIGSVPATGSGLLDRAGAPVAATATAAVTAGAAFAPAVTPLTQPTAGTDAGGADIDTPAATMAPSTVIATTAPIQMLGRAASAMPTAIAAAGLMPVDQGQRPAPDAANLAALTSPGGTAAATAPGDTPHAARITPAFAAAPSLGAAQASTGSGSAMSAAPAGTPNLRAMPALAGSATVGPTVPAAATPVTGLAQASTGNTAAGSAASAAAPSPGATQTVAGNAIAAPQAIALLGVAQPAVAPSGGFSAAIPDRFAPRTAAPDASGVASASATAGNAAAALAMPTAASASAAAPSGADGIADQLSGPLTQMVTIGPHEMVMRLHPPELGDLTVRVAVSGRDVSAWFASPQPQVQTAISAAMGQLQTNLGNAGYNLNGAWVGGDASGGGSRQQQPAPRQTASLMLPAAAALTPAVASRQVSSGLNVYV